MVNTFLLTKVNQYILDYEMFIMLMPNHFSGYPTSPYVIRPFDERDIAEASEIDVPRMRQFNKRLSSIRIASEHAFGHLKGRFPSLKEMGSHKDIEEMYKAIEAMMTLHNICIDWGDHPEDIWDFDASDSWPDDEDEDNEDLDADVGCQDIEGDIEVPIHETDAWLRIAGREKRVELLNELFPL